MLIGDETRSDDSEHRGNSEQVYHDTYSRVHFPDIP